MTQKQIFHPALMKLDTKFSNIVEIHKAVYVSGYIWGMAHRTNTTDEPPTHCTWSVVDGRIECLWISYDHQLATQNMYKTVFKKCGCRTGCKKNRKCKKGK